MSLPTHIYQKLNEQYGRKQLPDLRAGETVRVHQKVQEGEKSRTQIFEGLIIAVKHGRGLNGSFTVRKIGIGGVGVERVFPMHMPSIIKIDRVKKAKVRRSKLYYMRGRAGKGARFASETDISESWEEQLNEEVGDASADNAEVAEVKEEKKAVEKTAEKKEEEKIEEKKEEKIENKDEVKTEAKDVKAEKADDKAKSDDKEDK